MEVDAVVQADHHADLAAVAPPLHVRAQPVALDGLQHARPERLRQPAHVLGPDAEAPQPVHARHRADEVVVRHVGQRLQVRLVAAGVRDAAPGAAPLARPALVRRGGRVGRARQLHAARLEGRRAAPFGLFVPGALWRRGRRVAGQRGRVAHLLGAAAALAHEADGGGEDAAALLAGLDGAGGEGAAVAHALDVEQDGHGGGARQQEVAVARVHQVVGRHRPLRRRQGLRDDAAAVDAPRARRLPQAARVGEDILERVSA